MYKFFSRSDLAGKANRRWGSASMEGLKKENLPAGGAAVALARPYAFCGDYMNNFLNFLSYLSNNLIDIERNS